MTPRWRRQRRALLAGVAAWATGLRAQVPGSFAPARPTPPPSAPPAAPLLPVLAEGVHPRPLQFPADHAAHPETRTEWWYVTGHLAREPAPRPLSAATPGSAGGGPSVAPSAPTLPPPSDEPDHGFQLTFFRSRTGLAEGLASRFAARQLVFAHAALSDLGRDGRPAHLFHDQRTAREGFGLAQVPRPGDARQAVVLQDWQLVREPAAADGRSRLTLQVRTPDYALDLRLAGTQPVMLQGEAGYSRKGPAPGEASHYYSEPQLAVAGTLVRAGAPARAVRGRAWLDHEWSDAYLPQGAVGWDWIGIDLLDGGALMAFQMRGADGRVLWAGGARRTAGGAVRAFSPDEVRFTAGRTWRSDATQARYPVAWTVATPAGTHQLRALLDAQELDSRASTGGVYWEGVAELLDASGHRVGVGYLEMTGRAGALRM